MCFYMLKTLVPSRELCVFYRQTFLSQTHVCCYSIAPPPGHSWMHCLRECVTPERAVTVRDWVDDEGLSGNLQCWSAEQARGGYKSTSAEKSSRPSEQAEERGTSEGSREIHSVPAPGLTLERLQIVKVVANTTTFFHPLNPDDRGQGRKAAGVFSTGNSYPDAVFSI